MPIELAGNKAAGFDRACFRGTGFLATTRWMLRKQSATLGMPFATKCDISFVEERCYLDETASHLGIDRTTLYRWIRAGTIHPRREPGGRQFFYRSELDDLLDPQGHITRPLIQLHDQLHGLAQKLRRLEPEVYSSAREDARRLEGIAESLKPLISTYIDAQVPKPLGRPSKSSLPAQVSD